MAPDKPGFLEELKRRHVWRVAVAYAVAGWLLVQIATQVFPVFHMPDWTAQIVVLLVVLGFPVAVVFAWVYEITPGGVRRTVPAGSPDARAEFANRQVGRKLNAVIIAALALAVGLLGWRLLALRRTEPTLPQTAAAVHANPAGHSVGTAASGEGSATPARFDPPADTLVVLPFANMGGDPKQRYFSDGITEELTNALGQNTGLRVIAWDTASRYRDGQHSATEVARALDVANVLTGKILRQGNEVRVIVELVNARTGYQTWSSHYDDSLANIFQVQDKISAAIADALKVKFASLAPASKVNPQAYDLVLKARALMETGHTAAPIEQARGLLEQAIALEPDYAAAHAGLAHAWLELTEFSTLPLKEATPEVRAEAGKALAIDPRNVEALVQLGNVDASERRIARAKAEYERALAIDPSNPFAHMDYGIVLPLQQSLAQEQEAVRLDPENATAQYNLADTYLDLGRFPQALAPALALMQLSPYSADNALLLAWTYSLLHRDQDAVNAFDLAQPDTDLGRAMIAAARLAYRSVLAPGLHGQARTAVDAVRKRSDLDPTSIYDVIQLDLVLGEHGAALELLPQFCAGAPVGCTDLGLNPMWRPLRGEPRFQALVNQYGTTPQPATSSRSLQ